MADITSEQITQLTNAIDALNSSVSSLSQADAKSDIRNNRNQRNNSRNSSDASNFFRNSRNGKTPKTFGDAFEKALLDGLGASQVSKSVARAVDEFGKSLGIEIESIPQALGSALGKTVTDSIKKTDLGKQFDTIQSNIVGKFNDAVNRTLEDIGDATDENGEVDMSKVFDSFTKNGKNFANFVKNQKVDLSKNFTNAGEAITELGPKFAEMAPELDGLVTGLASEVPALEGVLSGGLAGVAEAAGGAVSGLGAMVAAIPLPQLALFAVAVVLIADKMTELLGPAIDGAKVLFEQLEETGNRYISSRKQILEYEKKRLTDDINAYITAPFQILEDAAKRVEDAWDSTLRTITATQGYTKSDVQDLMASFAQRLRSEGLTSVVAGSDILSSLEKVLQSGLSGQIAEEFAYQATKLNAAVPTQDFFSFVDTYASVAANAVKNGMTQTQAIAKANESLYSFANNLLYVSRELAGGFSTGLTNASELYAESVKIAQAARTGDVNQISSVLTAVSGIVGSIAPDLANALTSTIYTAATGGNNATTVALRSLANINASNTEFLKALANDPQSVFATLFTNLSNMFNDSSDAFMEKAEGYAEIFGLTAEEFQRVDFKYLADAISNMNSGSNALAQNIAMLQSGESTLTQEQLRIKRINEYMIDEGLAYVLDNEVARSIQENMWAEQRAREMMEATYGVELKGAALTFLEGIKETIDNILIFLNPLGYLKKIGEVVATTAEAVAIQRDLEESLERGKVGTGNAREKYQLTTRGMDLNLVRSYVDMLGGTSFYDFVSGVRMLNDDVGHIGETLDLIHHHDNLDAFRKDMAYQISSDFLNSGLNNVFGKNKSQYSWGILGKSASTGLSGLLNLASGRSPSGLSELGDAITKAVGNTSKNLIDKMLDSKYIQSFIEQSKSFDEWVASARNFGISDFQSVIDNAGYRLEDLEYHYQALETQKGAQITEDRAQKELLFYDTATAFYESYFEQYKEQYVDPLFAKLDLEYAELQIHTQLATSIDSTLSTLNTSFGVAKEGESLLNRIGTIKNKSIMELLTPAYDLLNGAENQLRNDMLRAFSLYVADKGAYSNIYRNTKVVKGPDGEYRIDTGYTSRYTKLETELNKLSKDKEAKEGDAVLQIAKLLSDNALGLEALTEPTVATNALLSQILIVLQAILQQNSQSAGTLSLADTLGALAMGMNKQE